MESITPFDWHRIFLGDNPPLFMLEIVFRVVAIYLFAALVLRLMGKRGNRSLSPFQNVVVIALGSATGDTMFYPQVPILYAYVVIVVIVALDRAVAWAQTKSRHVNTFVDGDPLIVVRHGRLVEGGLRKARLRPDELLGMLREQGVENLGKVRYAFLERSGQIGLFQYSSDEALDGTPTFPAETTRGLEAV